MKGHSYVVDLLKYMKMDNVSHADCLRKASDDLLLKQVQKPDLPTEVNSQLEYEVDRILAS